MKIAVFDTHRFERSVFEIANERFGHELTFCDHRLTEQTAKSAAGFRAVCPFVNDRLSRPVLEELRRGGTEILALRSAGFNHVDLKAAADLGFKVARVPAYSPHSVAEHAVMLVLALNRKICRASMRVHELNFSLDGLVGFDLHGKTVGVIGTGRIGAVFARAMAGFGCRVIGYDVAPSEDLKFLPGFCYASLETVIGESDIISLHVPLNPKTHHLIGETTLSKMKKGVMLINTGRGGLVDTKALIHALKSGQVGFAGLDVYEEEEGIFFQDMSEGVLADDVLARLMTFPNVLITSHQAFLTREALQNIAETTLSNVKDYEEGRELANEVRWKAE